MPAINKILSNNADIRTYKSNCLQGLNKTFVKKNKQKGGTN